MFCICVLVTAGFLSAGVYHPAEHGQYYPAQQTSYLQQQLFTPRSPYMAAGALLYSKDIVDHSPQQPGVQDAQDVAFLVPLLVKADF